MSEGPILSVRGLSAGYGDLRALADVDLDVWPGQVTCILGANGAGKTTALSAIAGLIPARSGTVRFMDTDVTSEPAYKRSARGMALVQEGKRVFRTLSIRQNLLLGGYRMKRRDRLEAVDAAYDRFPILGERRKEKAGSLSGGQQQMLAIAQAMMSNPAVVMLDEPSAGLAPIVLNEVMDSISSLKAEGIAIVLVEQLVGRALGVADHVVVLKQGSVVISRPADTVNDSDFRDAYLRGSSH